MNTKRNPATAAAICCLALIVLAIPAAAQNAPDRLIFSKSMNPSVISQSLAGAGTAMPLGGFQGLVNPALTSALEPNGVAAAGYGRDKTFDNVALPFGVVHSDGVGALGAYYRYLEGEQGRVHDAVINLAGRMFEQMDEQGPVEFGVNIRYENSWWRYISQSSETSRTQNILFDIGFYQPRVVSWLDFAIALANLNGYTWHVGNGTDVKTKEKGWIGWRSCTFTVGTVTNIPLSGNALLFQIPFDLEITNVFTNTAPTKYIVRTGLDTRLFNMVNLRFGYAHAPEDPMDLLKDFDHKNLFFGGIGVMVKPIQIDFFAGKDEFGVSVGYWL